MKEIISRIKEEMSRNHLEFTSKPIVIGVMDMEFVSLEMI